MAIDRALQALAPRIIARWTTLLRAPATATMYNQPCRRSGVESGRHHRDESHLLRRSGNWRSVASVRNRHAAPLSLAGAPDASGAAVRHRAPGPVLAAHVVEPSSWNQIPRFCCLWPSKKRAL